MVISETDVEMYAARIRLHFPAELRETAFSLALPIARIAGARAKLLRAETTIDEIYEWLDPHFVHENDSLDKVATLMAMEEQLGPAFVLPDELAARTATVTFRELVQFVAAKKRAA